jgi:putative DNA primase/helicase
LDDPDRQILIVKDEPNAASLAKHGYAAVAVPEPGTDDVGGADDGNSGQRVDDPSTLIPELQRVVWAGRKVYLCLYGTRAPKSKKVESDLIAAIQERGATVRVVILPERTDPKMILLDNGTAAMDTLLERGENPQFVLDAQDPYHIARVYLGDCHRDKRGRLLLRWHLEEAYKYEDQYYKRVSTKNITSALWPWLARQCRLVRKRIFPFAPNELVVRNVRCALDSQAMTEAPPGNWLVPNEYDDKDLIPVQNGLYCFQTREVLKHTPDFFSIHRLNFAYDPKTIKGQPERLLRILDQWFGDDLVIQYYQEILGFLVVPINLGLQKIVFLYGPPRSGKGTTFQLLEHMVGKQNVVTPKSGAFAYTFGSWSMIGKQIIGVTDTRLKPADADRLLESLLTISGGDSITIERKYKEPWVGKIDARIVLISNDLPNIKDSSGAFVSRIVPLHFVQSFLGQEDTTLMSDLNDELPTIFDWALAGFRRLRRRGHFNIPGKLASDVLRAMQETTSTMGSFVSDCCVVRENAFVARQDLYTSWKQWCVQHGHQHGSTSTMGRQLSSYMGGRLRSRTHRIKGRQIRCYVGIGLKR